MTVGSTSPARQALARARALYDVDYARRYREHDAHLHDDANVVLVGQLLRHACRALPAPRLAVLDLGCGTGRYFEWLEQVGLLVGVDASPAMLAEARRRLAEHPTLGRSGRLIEGDLGSVDFRPGTFDLVYAIGVLAEHAPLTAKCAARMGRWLRPGGMLVLTTVHPLSPSISGSPLRRAARALLRWAPASARRWLVTRLCRGGFYADESTLDGLLTSAGLQVEEMTRFSLGARWQCLCAARKGGPGTGPRP